MEKDVLTVKIKDYLEHEVSDDDFNALVELADSYLDFLDYDKYYPMDEFDDFLSAKTPTEILNLVDYDFNINDKYFKLNSYGYFESSDEIDYSLYIDEVTDFIVDNIDHIEQYYNCGVKHYVISDIIDIKDGDVDAE